MRKLYVLTSGDYEDYGIVGHIEGPDGFDILPYIAQAEEETNSAWADYVKREEEAVPKYNWKVSDYDLTKFHEYVEKVNAWKEENPKPLFMIDRLVELLSEHDFKRVQATEIRDGDVQ